MSHATAAFEAAFSEADELSAGTFTEGSQLDGDTAEEAVEVESENPTAQTN
jgi:hypothetical protein